MLNLFAFRATDPKVMKAASDPIGPDNDTILHQACGTGLVIAAWGAGGRFMDRDRVVTDLLRNRTELQCLGTTKHGDPRHPLYLRNDAEVVPWRAHP